MKKSNFKKKTNSRTQQIINNKTKHEIISIQQFSKISMVFWIGGSSMTALVMFPLIFRTLDQITASYLAGQILNIIAYIGIISLSIALIETIINYKLSLVHTKRFWYIISMGTILVINHFAIFPIIHRFRKKISLAAHEIISIQSNVFDFWHSFSAILFIITCIIGLLYLIEM